MTHTIKNTQHKALRICLINKLKIDFYTGKCAYIPGYTGSGQRVTVWVSLVILYIYNFHTGYTGKIYEISQ
jgi:hypothetical protein